MLTDAAIKKLKAPATGQRDIADGADVKGLVVRVSSKARVFYMTFRAPVDGKQARIRIGEYGAISLEEAREKGRSYRRLLEQGIDPREHERQEAERKLREAQEALQKAEKQEQNTFARAVYGKKTPSDDDLAQGFEESLKDGFLAHCRKANLRRWRERKRYFDVYVPSEWRDRQIDEITRDDVETLLGEIEAERGPVIANRVIESLRAMFNWLIAKKRATDNPAAKLQSDVPEVERDRVLSDNEVSTVWNASEGLSVPYRAYIRLLLLTGQRRNEVATMRWRDVDLDGAIWEIPRDSSKMDRAHTVPLSPVAIEILGSLPRFAATGDNGFVFTTGDGTTHIAAYSKIKAKLDELIAEAVDKGEGARVDSWRIHDLRRSAASGMARFGVALHVIEKVLNHSGGAISGVAAIYNRHGYDAEKRQALEAWANHVAIVADTSGKLLSLPRRA